MDRLNRAIEFGQYGPEYHGEDFESGIKRYHTAARSLRQELVRETGLLYLVVLGKYRKQRPVLVAIPAQL